METGNQTAPSRAQTILLRRVGEDRMPDTDGRLQAIFRGVFNLLDSADVSRCRQVSTPEWDSMAHVSLVAAIESEFSVSIDAADSITLTSYEATRLYLEELTG